MRELSVGDFRADTKRGGMLCYLITTFDEGYTWWAWNLDLQQFVTLNLEYKPE